MRPVFVSGVGLWTPGFATAQDWLNCPRDPEVLRPSCTIMNSRIARYTSLLTRMAVNTVEQAAPPGQDDLSQAATIFGSAHGEIQIAFEQLDMIERDGVPSPARFKNSVHNTASGHVAIGTGNMGFSTAIAAGEATFAMCVLEAWAWIESHGGAVIISVAEEHLPDHLATVGRYDPLGIAILLRDSAIPGSTLGRLSDLRCGANNTTPERIPERFRENPSAVALLLVEAALRKQSGTVPLEFGGEAWSAEFQAASGAATS